MKYIDKDEFYYEMLISKAKGKLTKVAENMFLKIAYKMIKKFEYSYQNPDDKFDCLQQGLMMMFQNWMSYDELKYKDPFPYFSEICKRGMAEGLTQLYEERKIERFFRTKELQRIRKEKRTSVSGNKNK